MQQIGQDENIMRYSRLMADDEEIITLRQNVRKAAESKLEHGIIDVNDLVRAPDAIAVAERNARELKAKVRFAVTDILTAVPQREQYDIIVSNPPYIANSERKAMESNVLDYEPHTALFVPDDDPLRFYRAITQYAVSALKPGGQLYFEINPRFADDTARLLTDAGLQQVELQRDYTDRLRFATARKP